jgi:DDE family transposase
MGSDCVIIGCLPEGHLLDRRRAADLAHRHLAECEHEGVLPLGRQRLPNWMGRPIAHRGIQASAPRHTMPGDRISATRRVVSNYQRCLVWDIELFFKWIKQHLRIKRFYGTSENAVKTQIWIAVSVYVLVAIIKKRLDLDTSLYTLMQVLSVAIFEKIPIQTALSSETNETDDAMDSNQLNLFAF